VIGTVPESHSVCIVPMPRYVDQYVNVNVNQNFFSVAKTAELLRSPQRRSRVTIQNQEMTVEKEMFLDVDGKQVGMEMT